MMSRFCLKMERFLPTKTYCLLGVTTSQPALAIRTSSLGRPAHWICLTAASASCIRSSTTCSDRDRVPGSFLE